MSTVKISRGNSKLGQIPSVSLPSVVTCRECACQNKCYARKLERLRPAVRNAYKHNLDILNNEPNTYWREVEASIMMSRFFRFHVSGDIPDAEYLVNMVSIANRNTHCEILCFTKKFEIVNEFIAKGGNLPANLHLVFSGWIGLEMINPCLHIFVFPVKVSELVEGGEVRQESPGFIAIFFFHHHRICGG